MNPSGLTRFKVLDTEKVKSMVERRKRASKSKKKGKRPGKALGDARRAKSGTTRRRRSFHMSGHVAAAKKSGITFLKYKIILTAMKQVKFDPLMARYLYSLIGGPLFGGLVEFKRDKPAYTSKQFVESDDKVVKQSQTLRQYHKRLNDHKKQHGPLGFKPIPDKAFAADWCERQGQMVRCSKDYVLRALANKHLYLGNETQPYIKFSINRRKIDNNRIMCRMDFYTFFSLCTTCCCSKGDFILSGKKTFLTYASPSKLRVKEAQGCLEWFNLMDGVAGFMVAITRAIEGGLTVRQFGKTCVKLN